MKIEVYKALYTPDSIEHGDAEKRWPDDTIECATVQDAIWYLSDRGYDTEIGSCDWFTDHDQDFRSGDETETTYHLHGFTRRQERTIRKYFTQSKGWK
jgi:hypothetical protein